ncbi:MAG: hypothetical protein GYB30_03195 [Gammaproteobacteria bacterium]|nr:hypothetical protein [Gammaproteobacteria bacterium]
MKTTFSSWFALISRFLLIIAFPIFLIPSDEVAHINKWGIFTIILTIQGILDFGLNSVAVRLTSQSIQKQRFSVLFKSQNRAIEQTYKVKKGSQIISGKRDYYSVINNSLNYLYRYLLIVELTVVLSIYLISKGTSEISSISSGVWVAIFGAPLISYLSKSYYYLYGANEVLKANALLSISHVTCVLITALIYKSLGDIDLAISFCSIALVICYFGIGLYWKYIIKPPLRSNSKLEAKKNLFSIAKHRMFAQMYRSGVGNVFSIGMYQMLILLLSFKLGASESGKMILSMQLAKGIAAFTQAPFYSAIPKLNGLLHASSSRYLFQVECSNKILISSGLFFLAALFFYEPIYEFFDFWFFKLTTSKITPYFVLPFMAALVVERAVGMLNQVYAMNNVIKWHKYNAFVAAATLTPLLILRDINHFDVALLLCLSNFMILIYLYFKIKLEQDVSLNAVLIITSLYTAIIWLLSLL